MRMPTVEEITAADSEMLAEFSVVSGVNFHSKEDTNRFMMEALANPGRPMHPGERALVEDAAKWLVILRAVPRFLNCVLLCQMLPNEGREEMLSAQFQLGYTTGYKNGQADALDLEKSFNKSVDK